MIEKEHKKYINLTKFMDKSADWNAPKTTRTLLFFLANYGLVEPGQQLPPSYSSEDLEGELAQATDEAMDYFGGMGQEALVKEQFELAKIEHKENAKEIDEQMRQYLDKMAKVNREMGKAERKVMDDYKAKSLKYRLGDKLRMVFGINNKIGGKSKDKGWC
jgi:hypothetical protein